MKRYGRKLLLIATLLAAGIAALIAWNSGRVGKSLDSYKGVAVYDNGLAFFRSHGKNFAPDGYYFGQKWQCVEFIKRFYYQAKGHKMPDAMGNAKSFFEPDLPDGSLNSRRQLVQFHNGSTHAPRPDDLLVFDDTHFGHVGIITRLGSNSLQIIQQNVLFKTRQTFTVVTSNEHFYVTSPRRPAGWLRSPENNHGERVDHVN
jgi:CHAP domain